MAVFFTSDLHVGHAKIAQLRLDAIPGEYAYADDEGEVIDWHDDLLARNWDSVVRKDDQVHVLGDISAGGSAAQRGALAWLAERPGEKFLWAGNHDGVHPMHRDAHKWMDEYCKVFAKPPQPFGRRKIAGKSVLLSHFPYTGDHTEKERFEQYRLRDCGELLLHGHVHTKDKVTYTPVLHFGVPTDEQTAQIHVGVDAWDFTPVHLDELATIVETLGEV